MTACLHCRKSRGKRHCPALAGPICAPCCGRHRLVEIRCPEDCPYLGSERYQADRRQERGVRKGVEYVRSRARLFPEEESFAFAMEVEERVYRWVRLNGTVDEGTIASALESMRAAFSTLVVAAAPGHPLAKDLVEAALDREGPFAKYRERVPGARAKMLARLVEDVRGRAGASPGYLELLRPFFDEVADPRVLAAAMRARGPGGLSPGGIILP